MASYFFDVHNIVAAAWDEHGFECPDRAAVEAHVRHLLVLHQSDHDGGRAPVSVSVLDNQRVILTASLNADASVNLVWR